MNMIFKLFSAGALMFLGVACTSCEKENENNKESDIPMEQVSYKASNEIIVNPERGFYKDMAAMREAGVKCVLRFAYTSLETEPDAPLSIIQTHIDQLKPYLAKNADVIAVWQAGFIGSWGEWYYTTNNLNTPSARKAVLDKLLEALPEGRVVQVRTPQYKQEYLRLNGKPTTALTAANAYTNGIAARIGHHNDCFMASETDYGTYQNVTEDKKYLGQEGLYLPMGGETCPPDGVSPADCSKAQEEMRNLRWSYLNSEYYENGKLKLRGKYGDNIPKGTWKYYTEEGEFERKEKY